MGTANITSTNLGEMKMEMKLLNPYLCESTKDLCRWRRRMKMELSMNAFSDNRRKKIHSAIKCIEEVLLERIIEENN